MHCSIGSDRPSRLPPHGDPFVEQQSANAATALVPVVQQATCLRCCPVPSHGKRGGQRFLDVEVLLAARSLVGLFGTCEPSP